MGKLLAATLIGGFLLVNPTFADGFSFTKTYYSVWNNAGQRLELITNPEDDIANWSNANTNFDVSCRLTVKKETTAVFNCDGKALRLRYDAKSGKLYANDFAYDRVK